MELIPTPEEIKHDREAKLKDMPKSMRNLFRQAWATRSRKSAIRAFCLECMGHQASEVPFCTSTSCPLWEYRRKHIARAPQERPHGSENPHETGAETTNGQ